MLLKANAGKIVRRGDGQEGTPWQYTVGYSVEESLNEGFFNSAVHNFLIGDEIRVVRQEKSRVTELLDLIVVAREMNPPLVEVDAISETRKFALPRTEAEETLTMVDEVHVQEDCTAQFKGPVRMWEIVGTSGTVYATGISDGDEAKSIARGDLPIPISEKEAA